MRSCPDLPIYTVYDTAVMCALVRWFGVVTAKRRRRRNLDIPNIFSLSLALYAVYHAVWRRYVYARVCELSRKRIKNEMNSREQFDSIALRATTHLKISTISIFISSISLGTRVSLPNQQPTYVSFDSSLQLVCLKGCVNPSKLRRSAFQPAIWRGK